MKAVLSSLVKDPNTGHVAYVQFVDDSGKVVKNKNLPYDPAKPAVFEAAVKKVFEEIYILSCARIFCIFSLL